MLNRSHVQHQNRGFTLIEVLIAIAIIAVLSTITYASFTTSREIARDNTRKTDLKNLQVAIELYKAQYGRYPDGCNGSGAWSGQDSASYICPTPLNSVIPNCNGYICGLVPDFIAKLPADPDPGRSASAGYIYTTTGGNGSATQYKLMAYASVEHARIKSYDDAFARCPVGTGSASCPSGIGAVPQSTTYAVYRGAAAKNW